MSDTESRADSGEPLPLVAPANTLSLGAPFGWLRRGWADIRRAPLASLSYGVMLVLFSYLITYLVLSTGNHILLFSLLTGFVLVGPVLAFSLYDISCQISRGKTPTLGHCALQSRKHLGNELMFAVVLTLILLVWARAASMIHVFFPTDGDPSLAQLATFLGIGSSVGAVFASFVFAVSAFSLPMMMDRKVDVVTAIITSINAVLRNKGAMLVWATLIVGLTLVGFATAFVGLAVLMPLIGHATWHGYRETIRSDVFPPAESV
ncbi:MAG: DUF2189 domain-containing protein [Gammaproteobacteria bacterium]|nr:DUF2189 domain-containing protein [Gammaproteobacteria bacterium]